MTSRPVLFITSEFPPVGGGIGVFVSNLARVLANHGRECWIATWGRASAFDAEKRLIQIPFIPLPPLGDQLFAIGLRRLLKKHPLNNPIVSVQTPYPQPAVGCEVAMFHIVVRHVIPRGEYRGVKRLQYRVGLPALCRNERKLLESPTICSVSNSTATDLREEYEFKRDIVVVGNGVDPALFRPGEKSEQPLVLYTGRLDLNKGVIDFVRMARVVLRRHPSAVFHIVGRGPAMNATREEIRRLGLGGRLGNDSSRGHVLRNAVRHLQHSEQQRNAQRKRRPFRSRSCAAGIRTIGVQPPR